MEIAIINNVNSNVNMSINPISNQLAPIALFVFNRPEHTQKTLNALCNNYLVEQSELFVFCDGPRENNMHNDKLNITAVLNCFNKSLPFKNITIQKQEKNLGLKNSIQRGIDTILEKYETIIILEDDIETAPSFLQFMNQGLTYYFNNNNIMHLAGFTPESIFQGMLPQIWTSKYMFCWGWATWRRSWKLVVWDVDYLITHPNLKSLSTSSNIQFRNIQNLLELQKNGKIDTWDVQWHSSIIINNGICLNPKNSLTRNIGFDGSGSHFNKNSINSDSDFYEIKNLTTKNHWKFKLLKNSLVLGNLYISCFLTYKTKSIISFMKILIYDSIFRKLFHSI